MKRIFILMAAAVVMGCSDFLEVDLPSDQLTADLVFKDGQLAKSAMAGVYRSLEEKGFLSGSSMGGGVYMGCYADELVSYAVSTSNFSQFYFTTINAQSAAVKALWNDTYNQVYAVNRIIVGLNASESVEQNIKNQLLGEAYFVRAFLHFYLAETYGSVPYVKSVDYRENSTIGKKSPDEILNMALEDLNLAEDLLPGSAVAGAKLRPTKVAVNALQARIYLFLGNWDMAIAASSKVISQGSYIVETDLNKTFKKESRSSIWQLEPLRAGNNTRQGALYTILSAPPTQISLTLDFVNSFYPGDGRKAAWIGSKSDTQQNTFFFSSKYKQSGVTPVTLEHSIVLRVEEQFLIRAEAYLRKKQYALAVADLNVIRGRTGLSPIVFTDEVQLLDAIVDERRFELFTEFGHRFFDLKRLDRIDQQMGFYKPQWKSFNKNLPIPEAELLLNANLLPQNDGY